jgi:mono/diheme cytochrome c family protein
MRSLCDTNALKLFFSRKIRKRVSVTNVTAPFRAQRGILVAPMPRCALGGSLLLLLLASDVTVAGQRAGDQLPPGEGRELVAAACSQCHGLQTIAAMRDGPMGWKVYLYDMILRGAQLNSREADIVLQYLVKNLGATAPKPASTASIALPNAPGKELVETRCAVCHDLGRVTAVKRQKTDWDRVISDMVARGAAIPPDEIRIISSYLVAQFGAP